VSCSQPPGHFETSEPTLISWQHNLITDENNNQISSKIVYHKNKPILEFDYLLLGKSKYILNIINAGLLRSG